MKRYTPLYEARRYKGNNPDMSDRKMNKETYALRKEVMQYVYRAKKLLKKKGYDMPRVNVRITDVNTAEFIRKDEKVYPLGQARQSDIAIWIPASTISSGYSLHGIVFHEILHAVFGIAHKNSDPLMKPTVSPDEHHNPSKVDKLFINNIKMGDLVWKDI